MKRKEFLVGLAAVLAIIMTACGPANDNEMADNEQSTPMATAPASNSDSQDDSGYPGPDVTEIEAYPGPASTVPSASAYPAPVSNVDENKRFVISGPVDSGETMVKGSGPPDTPIKIVSISHAGEALGFGTVNSDGQFSIELERPTESRESIGIQLSDESLQSAFTDAPGTDIPMIGQVFDQLLVEP